MSDARYERSRAAVHDAVCRVLVAEGISGLTADRLAAESGVSRSTIYRNWPHLGSLAVEVFDDLMHREPVDLDRDPVQALHDYLADYARRLNDPTYTAVLVALIDDSMGPGHLGRKWSVPGLSFVVFDGMRVAAEYDYHDKGARQRSLES